MTKRAEQYANAQEVRDIKDYSEFTQEEQAEHLDPRIARLDHKNSETIMSYGKESLLELGQVSAGMSKEIEKQDAFITKFQGISESIVEMDFQGLQEQFSGVQKNAAKAVNFVKKNPGKAAATGGALVVAGPLAAAAAAGAAFGIPWAKKKAEQRKMPEYEREAEQFVESLRGKIAKTTEIFDDLEEANENASNIMAGVNTLMGVRVTAHKAVTFDIIAAIEVRRRWEDDLLPKLEAKQADDYTDERFVEIEDTKNSIRLLDRRITDMISSRALGKQSFIELNNMKNLMQEAKISINGHLEISKPTFEALVAQAGLQLMSQAVAKTLAETGRLGDSLVIQSVELSERTTQMIADQSGRGAVGADTVIEAMQRTTANIEKQTLAIAQQGEAARESQLKLLQASQENTEKLNKSFGQAASLALSAPEKPAAEEQDNKQGAVLEGEIIAPKPKKEPKKKQTAAAPSPANG